MYVCICYQWRHCSNMYVCICYQWRHYSNMYVCICYQWRHCSTVLSVKVLQHYVCVYMLSVKELQHCIQCYMLLTVIEHPQVVDLGFGLGVEESFIRYAQMGQQLMGWVEYTHVHKLLHTRAFILQRCTYTIHHIPCGITSSGQICVSEA